MKLKKKIIGSGILESISYAWKYSYIYKMFLIAPIIAKGQNTIFIDNFSSFKSFQSNSQLWLFAYLLDISN